MKRPGRAALESCLQEEAFIATASNRRSKTSHSRSCCQSRNRYHFTVAASETLSIIKNAKASTDRLNVTIQGSSRQHNQKESRLIRAPDQRIKREIVVFLAFPLASRPTDSLDYLRNFITLYCVSRTWLVFIFQNHNAYHSLGRNARYVPACSRPQRERYPLRQSP